MQTVTCVALLLAFTIPNIAIAQDTVATKSGTASRQDGDAINKSLLNQGVELIQAGKPDDAIPLFDRIITDEEKAHSGNNRLIFCARSPTETLLYLAMAAQQKKAAVVLDETWAGAIFQKGFAYIDVGRAEEAKQLYEQAIAMSPMNSHYISELAEWYRTHNDSTAAYAKFSEASDDAEFSPEYAKNFDKRRALRGMAFILSDEGKFDEAEALYDQCLKLNPNDDKAKHELEYIREQRNKGKSAT